jgi:hypothetical protein
VVVRLPRRRRVRMRHVNVNPQVEDDNTDDAVPDDNEGRDCCPDGVGREWHTHMTSASSSLSPAVSGSFILDSNTDSDGVESANENENPPGKKRKNQ